MIAIIDYGLGNIRAFANVYKRLDIPHMLAVSPGQLEQASHIILPGVGAFDHAMDRLNRSGMMMALHEMVIVKKRPVLGICVGMQMLAGSSEEGVLPGLGWIDGIVKKFDVRNFDHKTILPHMGWNTVIPTPGNPLLEGIDADARFYFLHSYYFSCTRPESAIATTGYGITFASAVAEGNIFGVQFHPEKSHQNGIRVLKNFATL